MSAAPASPRRTSTSLGSTLLRRGWVILASMLGVGLLAYAVAGLQGATYTGQSILVVSPAVGPSQPGNSDQAEALARTYVRVIPQDEELQRLVRRATGTSGRITATGAPESAVVRVSYTASSREDALAGGRAIADALSSERQLTASVTPRSLKLVRRPTTATLAGGGYRATVLLFVNSGATSAPSVNADQANKLAASYAGLIAADERLLSRAAERVGVSASELQENLEVVSTQDTSLITITYKADSAREAAQGARGIAKLVIGPRPVPTGVVPNSLQAVSLPDPDAAAEPTTDDRAPAVAVGLALGLMLGLVLLVAWERSDPHVRDSRDLSAQIGCPATPADRLSPDAAGALLERWAALTDQVPAHVAILPAEPGVERATERVAELLLAGGADSVRYEDARSGMLPENGGIGTSGGAITDVVLVHAAAPGSGSAGEAVALSCDLTVVVVPRDTRAAEVRALADDLANFGIVPAWALLTPRRESALRGGDKRERVASA